MPFQLSMQQKLHVCHPVKVLHLDKKLCLDVHQNISVCDGCAGGLQVFNHSAQRETCDGLYIFSFSSRVFA